MHRVTPDALDAGTDPVAPARRWTREVATVVVALALLQCVFFAALFAAQAVPDDPIVDHVQEAIDAGLYGPVPRPDLMGGRSSAHSECVIAGTGLGEPDMSVFERTVRMPRISSCRNGDEDIALLARGMPAEGVTSYFRYWGGYTVLTRPILAIWGWEALRMALGGLLVVSAVVAAVALVRTTRPAYAIGLGLPMVFGSNLLSTPSSSFGLSLSFAVTFLSVALTAFGARAGMGRAALGAAAGAALFTYFTQLTTPAIPWMWSAGAAGAVVACSGGSVARTARAVALVGVVWPLAFAFTWASRWAIAAVFLGWDEASSGVRDKVDQRLGGSAPIVDLSSGASTRRNLQYWLETYSLVPTVVAASLVAIAVCLIVATRRYGPHRLGLFAVLAAPAIVTPVWYEVLRNHSQVHAPFVYANLPAALGVVLAAACLTTVPLSDRHRGASERGAAAGGERAGPVDEGGRTDRDAVAVDLLGDVEPDPLAVGVAADQHRVIGVDVVQPGVAAVGERTREIAGQRGAHER
jgi:hypothetical protein